jgi:hypothetical protein
MRDIPTEEMAGYGERIPIMRAEWIGNVVKDFTGHMDAGTIVFQSDMDSLLSNDKAGVGTKLPVELVEALKRRLQPELINDPVDFVNARVSVLTFDHTRDGDLGAANLETRIRLNFSGDYESDLLTTLEKQLKKTKGVPVRDIMELTQAELSGQIGQYFREGFLGEDLSRQGEAAARAMAMMQTIEKKASSGKYASAQEMMDDFGSMMRGPMKERARGVMQGMGGGPLDGPSLLGMQGVVSGPSSIATGTPRQVDHRPPRRICEGLPDRVVGRVLGAR